MIVINGRGGVMKTKDSVSCKRTVSNIKKLGPDTKKYFKDHIEVEEKQ